MSNTGPIEVVDSWAAQQLHGSPEANDALGPEDVQALMDHEFALATDPNARAAFDQKIAGIMRVAREISDMDPISRAALLLTDEDLK